MHCANLLSCSEGGAIPECTHHNAYLLIMLLHQALYNTRMYGNVPRFALHPTIVSSVKFLCALPPPRCDEGRYDESHRPAVAQVVHVERMPSRKPRCATPAYTLLPPVHKALASRGVSSTSLFTHQAAAIDSLLSSKHTVIATSTASGKSLCYLVPILQVGTGLQGVAKNERETEQSTQCGCGSDRKVRITKAITLCAQIVYPAVVVNSRNLYIAPLSHSP